MTLEEYMTQIQQAVDVEDYQTALDWCQQALQEYPKEGTLYKTKANVYLKDGEKDMALGTLDYGYKQTGWEELKQMKELYDTTQEEDIPYEPAQVAPGEEEEEMEPVEDYVSYELPDISLPHVEPLPEPTPEPTPQPTPQPTLQPQPEIPSEDEAQGSDENQ